MIHSYACISYCSILCIYLSECCSSIYFEIYWKNSVNNLLEIISRRNKSITTEVFSRLKFSYGIRGKMSNRSREPTMERRSSVAAAATRKGSRSSPEKRESMKEQMDHNVSVLASRLEEEFACVSSSASPEIWYIDSGASTHMMGVRECFSSY